MSPLAVRLRFLPRSYPPLHATPIRAFHSPFVVLNAPNRLAPAPPATAALAYEKQDDGSPEPHLSSSGTRTYVVSEPDPSNTPYQVPSGAYPTSTPYVINHKEAGIGGSAAVRNAAVPEEMGYRGVIHSGISTANIKPDEL